MSKVIDERVVSMQFDNKQFESNVQTTMSTLDKLKAKLNFANVGKSLDSINKSAANCNLAPLSNAVDNVGLKFNAMYTIADQALRNITNSAMAAGKKIISALTVDPIKTGFQEYETQINATQTILSNTKSKGSDINDVNKALEELNKYADLTIYNFTEMTRNIGTFTAAGIDLDTSVTAIQGIANLAAQSGSTSQQAATAMYQLSQALSSGTVRLMDWNSVVNAGMGGELFQNALRETSELLGTGAEAAIKTAGSFRESLKDGWLSAEVLTQTLKKFTTSGANERVAEYTGLTKEAVAAAIESAKAQYGEGKAIEYASKALAEKSGKNAEEIENVLEFAKEAEDAATKVKTLTQLWEVMKESAQSGWSQTWKIIVGDFNEARDLFTPLADFFTGVIGRISDARNNLLEGALNFPAVWKSVTDKISGSLGIVKKVTDSIGDMSDKVTYFQDIVNDVWRGDYATADTGRYEMLEAAGYDHRVVQDLVNLGYEYKITVDDIKASHKKFGLTVQDSAKETENLNEVLANLSDEQLREAGLTEAEIKVYRDLAREAESTSTSISELAEQMSKVSGRTLLIESLKNAGKAIVSVFTAMADAWNAIFPPMSVVRLYFLIDSFHKFSEKLVLTEATTEKLTRAFKGVFAAIDIVATLLGGGFRLAFQAVTKLLALFDLDILEAVARIGDMLVSVRDWIDEHNLLNKTFDKFGPKIKETIVSIGNWISKTQIISKIIGGLAKIFDKFSSFIVNATRSIGSWLRETELIPKALSGLTRFFKTAKKTILGWADGLVDAVRIVKDWMSGIKDAENTAEYIADGIWNGMQVIVSALSKLGSSVFAKVRELLGIESLGKSFSEVGMNAIQGFINGISSGLKLAWDVIKLLGTRVLESIKSVLGIQSPSTEFFAIGGFIVAGLIAGLVAGGEPIRNTVMDIGSSILSTIKEFDYAKLVSVIVLGGVLVGFLQIAKAISNVSKPFAAAAEVMEEAAGVVEAVGDTVKNFAKVVKSYSGLLKAKAVKELAISLGVIAASVAVLSFIPAKKLWGAVGAMAALAAVLIGMSFAVSLLNKVPSVDFGKTSLVILSMSVAALLMASTMKKLEGLNPDTWKQTIASFVIAIVALGGLIVALGMSFKKDKFDVGGTASLLFKLTATMTVFAILCKVLGSMSSAEATTGVAVLTALGGIVVGIIYLLEKIADPKFVVMAGQLGSVLLKISGSLAIMSVVVKLLGRMSSDELANSGIAMTGLLIVIGILTLIAKKVGNSNFSALGNTLLKMSASILLLAVVTKMIGNLNETEIATASKVLIGFVAIIMLLTAIVNMTKKDTMDNLGKIILGMSASMIALAVASKIFGTLNDTEMANASKALLGLVAVIMILAAIVKAVGGGDVAKIGGTIFAISTSLVVLAAACALLSLFDPLNVIIGATALTMLMLAIAVILESIKDVKNAAKTILSIAAAVVTLAVALGALSFIAASDMTSFLVTAGILVALMGMFSVMMLAAGKATGSIGNLIAMTVAVGVMGGLLYLLQGMDAKQALAIAGALSMMMLVLAGALAISGIFGGAGSGTGILAAAAGMLVLAGALWILASIPLVPLVIGLGALVIALAAIVAAGALLSMFSVGAAALSGTLLSLAAVILAIGVAFVAFSASLYIIGLALPLIADGFAKLGEGLVIFITKVASCYEDAGKFLITMWSLAAGVAAFGAALLIAASSVVMLTVALVAIAAAILIASIGAIGFAAALYIIGLALPLLGEGLAVLGEGLKSFIDNVASCIEGVGNFETVMGTAGTAILDFLLKLAGGLAVVGVSAMVFALGCISVAAGLTTVGVSLFVITAGILALSVGFVGLGVGASLAALGVLALGYAIAFAIEAVVNAIFGIGDKAMSAGSDLVEGFANGITSTISSVKNAVGNFVDSCISTICNLLGIESPSKVAYELGAYTGEGYAQGLDDSTEKVNESAENLANSAQDTMETAGSEGSTTFMDSLGDGIDLSGLDLGSFDMETLKSKFGGAGNEGGTSFLSGLSDKLSGSSIDISSFDLSSITSGFGDAGTEGGTSFLSGLSGTLGESSFDINSLNVGSLTESFGGAGEESGTSFLSGFSDNISLSNMDFSSFDTSSVTSEFGTSGTEAASSFADGVNSASGDVTLEPALNKMLTEVSDSIPDFGQAGSDIIVAFANGIEGGSSIPSTKASNAAKAAISAISNKSPAAYGAGSNIAQAFARGISDYSYIAINKAKSMAASVTAIVKDTLRIKSPSRVFMEIGTNVVDGFLIGLNNGTALLASAGLDLASIITSSAMQSLRDSSNLTTLYGEYTSEGFANGIQNGVSTVKTASETMAMAAHNAIRKTLGIHSPSTEEEKDGEYVDEGMAKGIEGNLDIVKSAAENVGRTVLGSVGNILSKSNIADVAVNLVDVIGNAISELEPPTDEQMDAFAGFVGEYITTINDVVKSLGLTSTVMSQLGDFIEKIGNGLLSLTLGMALITGIDKREIALGLETIDSIFELLIAASKEFGLIEAVVSGVSGSYIVSLATAILEMVASIVIIASVTDETISLAMDRIQSIMGVFYEIDNASKMMTTISEAVSGNFYKNIATAILELTSSVGILAAIDDESINKALGYIEELIRLVKEVNGFTSIVSAAQMLITGKKGTLGGSLGTTLLGGIVALLSYLVTELCTLGEESVNRALTILTTITTIVECLGALMAVLTGIVNVAGAANTFIAIAAIDALVASLTAIIGLAVQNTIMTVTSNLDSWGDLLVRFGEKLNAFAGHIEYFAIRMSRIKLEWATALYTLIDLYNELSALETYSGDKTSSFGEIFTNAVVDAYEMSSIPFNKIGMVLEQFITEIVNVLNTFTPDNLARIAAIGPAVGTLSESILALLDAGSKYSTTKNIERIVSILSTLISLLDIADKLGIDKISNLISDIANANFDITPTITPVVDMDNVEAAASAITDLFGATGTSGIVADVSGISASMNGYAQNGVDAVTEAINKVTKKLEDLEIGDTYIIDGITYDDGSNIANAVKSIIRETRMQERR